MSDAFDIYDPNTDYDFGYNRPLQAELPESFGVYFEQWNKDGSLKQRQFRAGKGPGGGRFGKGVTGDQGKALLGSMEALIRESLLQNYDNLIKGVSHEATGTLKRAVAEGIFQQEENFESYAFTFEIADLVRSRPMRSFGNRQSLSPDNSTRRYGPVIFKGRAAIQTTSPMVFPAYGGGKMVVTRFVKGVLPADIFELTDQQKRDLASAALPAIKKQVTDQIKAASQE